MTSVEPRNDVGGEQAAAPGEARRWRAFSLLAVAYFMTAVDLLIVNVALPTIGVKLHFAESDLQWVVTAYALAFGGFLLLGGRAADLLGRRRVFTAGLALFTAASLGCALATTSTFLIIMRGVQGLGRRRGAARRAVDRDEHVPRGRRAEQGARDLGRHRRQRGDRRRAGRRRPHPVRGLAVHLLPERRRRRGRAAAGPAGGAGEQAARRAPPLRPARRHHRDRRPGAGGVRDLAGADRRVDRRPDRWPCSRRRRPCWPRSWSSRPGRRRRCCRCGCSG